MTKQSEEKPTRLITMPGILVILTVAVLFVMHLGGIPMQAMLTRGLNDELDAAYLQVSASQVREPVNRARAKMGLDANDVVRRGEELYYLPDLAHLTGRSFLTEHGTSQRAVLKHEGKTQTNPLPAIIEFDRLLASRGIELVLLPTPSKGMFANPEIAPIHNEGFTEFLTMMNRHEIPVFDLAPLLAKFQSAGNRLFLKGDSHWTPETMQKSAILLSEFLHREGLLQKHRRDVFRTSTQQVTNSGDLARLINPDSPDEWTETVEVHPLQDPWMPDTESPVLLLGDSFTNIFSLAEMDWGRNAGLAETLSKTLGFSVDRLAGNSDGAFSSRRLLQHEDGRLVGKTVVIWQFAARELRFGNWQILPLPRKARPSGKHVPTKTFDLEGTVESVPPVPLPTKTPYRQAVMEIHLTKVTSSNREIPGEVVLLGMGIDNHEPTPMARWKPGRKVAVQVEPWEAIQERYGRLRRLALEDPDFERIDLPRVWLAE